MDVPSANVISALANEYFTNSSCTGLPIIFLSNEFNSTATRSVNQTVSDTIESVTELPGAQGISISIAEIHDVAPWLPQALQDAFPGLPINLLRPMLQPPDFNNSFLPLGRCATEFNFFIRYAVVDEKNAGEDAVQACTFGSCEVRSIPVAVWISSNKTTDEKQSKPPIPVIVLVCQHSLVCMKLARHLAREYPRKFKRLMEIPSWIYIDLSFVLSQWQEVWELAAGSILLQDAQLMGKAPTPSFLDSTQHLHHDCNSVFMLLDGLRFRINAMKAFQKSIKAQWTEERSK